MLDPVTGNYTSLADTGYTRSQLEDWFAALAKRTGATLEPSDVDALIAKLMGGSGYIPEHGGDPLKAFAEFEQNYIRRGGAANLGDLANIGTTAADLMHVPTAGVKSPIPLLPRGGASSGASLASSGLGGIAVPLALVGAAIYFWKR